MLKFYPHSIPMLWFYPIPVYDALNKPESTCPCFHTIVRPNVLAKIFLKNNQFLIFTIICLVLFSFFFLQNLSFLHPIYLSSLIEPCFGKRKRKRKKCIKSTTGNLRILITKAKVSKKKLYIKTPQKVE